MSNLLDAEKRLDTLYTEGCIGSSWKNFASRSGNCVPCTYWGKCRNSSTMFLASDWFTTARLLAFSTRLLSSNCILGGGTSFFLSFSRTRSVPFFSGTLETWVLSFFWKEAFPILLCSALTEAVPVTGFLPSPMVIIWGQSDISKRRCQKGKKNDF